MVEGATISTSYSKGKPSRNLWVGNLSESVTEAMLMQRFSEHGKVDSVDILADSHCAFVHMASEMDAKKAADVLHGSFIGEIRSSIQHE